MSFWREKAWLLRSYATHDDDCTINRYPHYRDCSCGLRAALSGMEEQNATGTATSEHGSEQSDGVNGAPV